MRRRVDCSTATLRSKFLSPLSWSRQS